MLHTFEEFWTENLVVSTGFIEYNVIEKTHIPRSTMFLRSQCGKVAYPYTMESD